MEEVGKGDVPAQVAFRERDTTIKTPSEGLTVDFRGVFSASKQGRAIEPS